MTLLQIILLIALGLLVGAAAFFLFSWKHTEKNAPKFDALGTVVGWQDIKIPFMGRAIIQCTKKGKPMQVQSNLMFRSSKPKQGLKRLWTVSIYRGKDNTSVYVARMKKAI